MSPIAAASGYFILACAVIYLDLIYFPKWMSAKRDRRRSPLVWASWTATTALSGALTASFFVAVSRMA